MFELREFILQAPAGSYFLFSILSSFKPLSTSSLLPSLKKEAVIRGGIIKANEDRIKIEIRRTQICKHKILMLPIF